VMEYFSFRGDAIWNTGDEELIDITARNLETLGFIGTGEVLGGVVVRVPGAYPLFDVGYREACDVIYDYLQGFSNFHLAGRSGMFRYYNMDHAIGSGIETAEKILGKRSRESEVRSQNEEEGDGLLERCEEICN
jgi:protoporphyrinogen oxidase